MSPNLEQVTIARRLIDKIAMVVSTLDDGKIGRADLVEKELDNQDINRLRQTINGYRTDVIHALNNISFDNGKKE